MQWTGDKKGGRNIHVREGKEVAVLHGVGLVPEAAVGASWPFGGEWGLAPTELTNGGIVRGGGAEPGGRYGTPLVGMGSASRSRREGKAFPSNSFDVVFISFVVPHLGDVVFQSVDVPAAIDDDRRVVAWAVDESPDLRVGLAAQKINVVVGVEGDVVGARFGDGFELFKPGVVGELNESHDRSPWRVGCEKECRARRRGIEV